MRKVTSLVEKTDVLKQKVYQRLPSNGAEVEEFVMCAQLAQHTEVKKCQQAKFQRILDKNTKNKDTKGSEDSNLASEIVS